MVNLKAVESIRKKYYYRHDGLTVARVNADASSRLAFGLCKKYGIKLPKGAKPYDAWKALKEKTGKSVADFYAKSGTEGADAIRFNTASPKSFAKALEAAKREQDPANAWRVTAKVGTPSEAADGTKTLSFMLQTVAQLSRLITVILFRFAKNRGTGSAEEG